MNRRHLLQLLTIAASRSATAQATAQAPAEGLHFPADFGAHPATQTEWWYVTGALDAGPARWGFQLTFFRVATGLAAHGTSRFDPGQLLFAHAAVSDVARRRLRHDQRIARSGFGIAEASSVDTAVTLRDWRLERSARAGQPPRGTYAAEVASDAAGFGFSLQLETTQPVLAQGNDAGVSRKGPQPSEFSRYYSEPQLAVRGALRLDGRARDVRGRAWLDHEWSDAFMPPDAVGWDWIGMNLDDGAALTAFRLRRADGSSVYAGGSYRAGAATRQFGPADVVFTPARIWESAATRARYPVQWTVQTPAGRYTVQAVFDDQELDSRASTGAIYWEGLSDLFDAGGERVGRGYLELTGYAAPLRL
jgi:predicted secreted hydrolase